MNLIDEQLQKIKQAKRLGLMTHVVIGFPSLEDTYQIVRMMAAEGADFIELQIPFSDPLGDGSTIRAANATALTGGVRVEDAFHLAKKLTKEIKIPLLFMTYLNIVYTYGLEKFCQNARIAGINGLIIPDYNLALETREHLDEFSKKNELELIRFTALNSSTTQLENLAKEKNGFIYCFSGYGVTGTRSELDPRLTNHLQKIHLALQQPLAVGFGISTAEHLRQLHGLVNVGIVGSALLKEFKQGGLLAMQKKMKELKTAL